MRRRRPRRPPTGAAGPADLEEVWGREASAHAAPVAAPEQATFAGRPAPAPERRGWWPIVGTGVAVVFLAAGLGVVALRDDAEVAGSGTGVPSTIDRPAATTASAWEPTWAAPVTCPQLLVSAETRRTACPVAADDERAYLLEDRGEDVTLVARSLVDGREMWALPFPDGASDVQRHPSAVVVVGVGSTSAVDPVTGEPRWQVAGFPVAPLGRDHLLVDDRLVDDRLVDDAGGARATTSVVETGSGSVTFSRSGAADDLTAFPCSDAGLVVLREPGRLTAVRYVDGVEAWSVDAVQHDAGDPLVCGATEVVELQGGVLVARDSVTGAVVARMAVLPPADDRVVGVLGRAGPAMVVSTTGLLSGFRADASLEPLWQADLGPAGTTPLIDAVDDGTAFAVPGDRAGWFGSDGVEGPQVLLGDMGDVVLDGGRLVAWGGGEVLVAPAADVGRARLLALDDVRRVAVGATFVVLTTRDEVRAYPFDP